MDRASELIAELSAAVDYMRIVRIGLKTGYTKATAVRTLDGGLKRAEAALAKARSTDTIVLTPADIPAFGG